MAVKNENSVWNTYVQRARRKMSQPDEVQVILLGSPCRFKTEFAFHGKCQEGITIPKRGANYYFSEKQNEEEETRFHCNTWSLENLDQQYLLKSCINSKLIPKTAVLCVLSTDEIMGCVSQLKSLLRATKQITSHMIMQVTERIRKQMQEKVSLEYNTYSMTEIEKENCHLTELRILEEIFRSIDPLKTQKISLEALVEYFETNIKEEEMNISFLKEHFKEEEMSFSQFTNIFSDKSIRHHDFLQLVIENYKTANTVYDTSLPKKNYGFPIIFVINGFSLPRKNVNDGKHNIVFEELFEGVVSVIRKISKDCNFFENIESTLLYRNLI